MGKIIKLYKTWEKAKQVFVKPSLKVYFGKWRNDPNLPVWRRGPLLYVCRRRNLCRYTHQVKDSVMIFTGTKKFKYGDKEYESKCYDLAPIHKLPSKLRRGDTVWNSNIRKKLKKWHLSWLPPIIKLPIWMKFHIVNFDLGWKTKWDAYRYEFPPQFTIIAFGLSLSLTLHCPVKNEFACDDHYWEAILNHLYANKSGRLKETIESTGIWRTWKCEDSDNLTDYFAVRPEYIAPQHLEEYYAAISEIKARKEKVIL